MIIKKEDVIVPQKEINLVICERGLIDVFDIIDTLELSGIRSNDMVQIKGDSDGVFHQLSFSYVVKSGRVLVVYMFVNYEDYDVHLFDLYKFHSVILKCNISGEDLLDLEGEFNE